MCFARMGYGVSGRCPIPFFLKAKEKKLDNPVQLACSIISEPLARFPRGLAASNLESGQKKGSGNSGNSVIFLAMDRQLKQAQDFWNRGLRKYLKLAGFFPHGSGTVVSGFALMSGKNWTGWTRAQEKKKRGQTFSST